jgi:hypothetical protein
MLPRSLFWQALRGTLERNAEIVRRFAAGERGHELAAAYGLTRQRIDQIVHREKHRARKAAQRLQRPRACQRCGALGRVDAHHRDHSRPLDVEFLCRGCHLVADGRRPAFEIAA